MKMLLTALLLLSPVSALAVNIPAVLCSETNQGYSKTATDLDKKIDDFLFRNRIDKSRVKISKPVLEKYNTDFNSVTVVCATLNYR